MLFIKMLFLWKIMKYWELLFVAGCNIIKWYWNTLSTTSYMFALHVWGYIYILYRKCLQLMPFILFKWFFSYNLSIDGRFTASKDLSSHDIIIITILPVCIFLTILFWKYFYTSAISIIMIVKWFCARIVVISFDIRCSCTYLISCWKSHNIIETIKKQR